jgi:hypothetical protein
VGRNPHAPLSRERHIAPWATLWTAPGQPNCLRVKTICS